MTYNEGVLKLPILAVLTVFLALAPLAAEAQQITVIVNPFENQTTDRNIDWMGEGLAALAAERLSAERQLYVYGRDERGAAYERIGIPETISVSRATSVKLAWDVGADVIVTGRITGTHDDFTISARALNLYDASSGSEIRVSGKLDDVVPMATTLAWELAKVLLPGSTIPESDYTSRPPIPRSAFEAYTRGVLTSDPPRRKEFLETAIRLHPQYAAALYQLGRMRHQDMDFKTSTALLEKVPAGSPEFAPAQFMLGLNHYYLSQFDKSAAIFSALPPSYDVLINLGAALAGKADAPAAQFAWKRATDSDPFGSEAVFNRAFFAFTRNEIDVATTNLDQFMRLHGRDAEAIFLSGRIAERVGRTSESQAAIAQAVRLSPRVERWINQPLPNLIRLRTQFNVTELRFPTGFWTPERLSRRASGQDIAAWLESVREQIDSQFYGEAIRDLQDMSRTFPMSADVRLLLGQVYERQMNYEAAHKEYRQSLQLKPSVDAYLAIARLYRTQNQVPSALQAIDEALKLEPGNPAAAGLKSEIERPTPRQRRGRQ